MKRLNQIAVTTGDIDGIGYEVTCKALHQLGPQRKCQFIVWKDLNDSSKYRALLKKRFKIVSISSITDLDHQVQSPDTLIEVKSNKPPAIWVEQAALLNLEGRIQSLVTGPLSKQSIKQSGLRDIGHTDILKRVSKKNFAMMSFFGEYFNVVLATGHIPLKNVEELLTHDYIQNCLKVLYPYKNLLNSKMRKRPIGILGLNPHAGDSGIIGSFEKRILNGIIEKGVVEGPLVPDVAFVPDKWKHYSFYLCLYHDQGLIPFKTVHGFSKGAHLTLGLPIKRSSVDHGTAKDIFNKDKADPGSMLDALNWGVRLCMIK